MAPPTRLKSMSMKFDTTDLFSEIDSYPRVTQRAIVSAVNVAGRRANKEIKQKVKTEYNVTAGALSRNIKLIPARLRGSYVTSFFIIVKNTRRGLIKYTPTETSTGVTAPVERARGRRNIRGGFIGNYKKGKTGPGQGDFVMVRTRRHHVVRFTPKGRYYIAEQRRTVYGPTIAQMYITRPHIDLFDKIMERDFEDILNEKFNQFAK